MVYIDLSKAFDKVDHGTLLHKLRALGISGNIGIWLYYFLTNRSLFYDCLGELVKTTYVSFTSNGAAYKFNAYIDQSMNIIRPSTHVLDLGISMSNNCTFDLHISNLYRRCSNFAGWILRTFTRGDPHVLLTLFWFCTGLIMHPSFGHLIY